MDRPHTGSLTRWWIATGGLAWLAFREAVRSRFLALLAALLAAVLAGFPLVLRGEGTLSGQVQIVLNYTLGAVVIVLAVATLWVACGLVSREIENRHLRLVVVKPVTRFQVWLGAWLALLAMNAAALTVAGCVGAGLVRWRVRSTPATPAERRALAGHVLTARRVLYPRPADVGEEVERRLAALRAGDRLPDGVDDGEARDLLRRRLLAERLVVAPGTARTWTFDIPGPAGPQPSACVRFQVAPVAHAAHPVAGTWQVRAATEQAPAMSVDGSYPPGVHRFDLPGQAALAGPALEVVFRNAGAARSSLAVFQPPHGLELRVQAGGFGANLARSLLVLWCGLAGLAALGLTMGCLFSFPVASFSAAAICAVLLLSRFYVFASISEARGGRHHHGGAVQPSRVETAAAATLRLVRRAAQPLGREGVLARLSDGILVSGAETAGAGVLALARAALLSALGTAALRRRELARSTAGGEVS